MSSPPLDNTHGRTTSGVELHHYPGTTHTVERRLAWHDITALGLHAQSDDVGHGMSSSPLGCTNSQTMSNDVGRGLTSPPLDCTHGRTMSGVACHHRLWAAQTVKQRRAWHDITALGQHTRSNDVGLDMSSPPLDSTHGRTTSGVELSLIHISEPRDRSLSRMPSSA